MQRLELSLGGLGTPAVNHSSKVKMSYLSLLLTTKAQREVTSKASQDRKDWQGFITY